MSSLRSISQLSRRAPQSLCLGSLGHNLRLFALMGVAMLTVALHCAETLPSDKGSELTGRWSAGIPKTVIGTGDFRSLLIRKSQGKLYLTVVHGSRDSLGANEEAMLLFRTTTTETGPYILSRTGDQLVYRDEQREIKALKIVVDEKRTILKDDTYDYYWSREEP